MRGHRTSLFFLTIRTLKDWRWRRRIYLDRHGPSNPVDREARQQLAGLLAALVSGEITNDQFTDSAPVESLDPAIAAIDRAAWTLTPDMKTCKLEATLGPDEETIATVEAWILFLLSDLQYQWHLKDPAPWLTWAVRLVGLRSPGVTGEEPISDDTWPFASMAEFEREVEKHAGSPPTE